MRACVREHACTSCMSLCTHHYELTIMHASLARCLSTFSLLRNLTDCCRKSGNMYGVNCGCNARIDRMVVINNASKNGKCVHVASDHHMVPCIDRLM